jgi:tetratricopeptide (TPR) repeat protein
LKQKKSPQAAPTLWIRSWPYLLLVALACGLYANALENGFVSDDHFQLLGNPLATDWGRLPQIFTHHVWAFAGGQTSNYYRPLQTLTYLVLHSFFGFSPFAFHLAIVLLHSVNTLLVYRLARRLLMADYAALVAAILFAVHPIHNEAVVWVAVLPDVLLTTIVLSALLWFVRWDGAPNGKQVAAIASLFFLALLTKEPGAMLLPLLAGYELLYLKRSLPEVLRRNWLLYASCVAVFGVYLVLRVNALGGIAPAQGVHYKLSGGAFILNVCSVLLQYFGELFAPIHLNYFHSFEPTVSALPLAAVVLVIVLAIVLFRSRLVYFSLFLVLVPLLPALNLNGVGENVVAERYLYLPSVGFVLLAAAAWQWLAAKNRLAAWSAAAALVVASAAIVLPRNLEWSDDEKLLTATIALSPKALAPLSDLGTYHFARGEYDAAIANYRAALQLRPNNAEQHHNLGNAFEREGRYAEAVAELRKSVELDPEYPEGHMSLGVALDESGDIAGAAAENERALALRPTYAEAIANLAEVRIKQRNFAAAIDLLQRTLAINPQSFEAQFNLGLAYNFSNRYAEGAAAFKKAIEMAPDHPNVYLVHYHLGVADAQMNAPAAAIAEFTTALQLRPDFTLAKDALAIAEQDSSTKNQ